MKYKTPCFYSKTGWSFVRFDEWGASCSCKSCSPPKNKNHYKVLYGSKLILGRTKDKLDSNVKNQ